MKTLALTLTAFFCLLFTPFLLEYFLWPPVTGRSLILSVTLCLAFTLLHCGRTQRIQKKQELRARLIRVLSSERGEAEGDCLNTLLVAVSLVAIVFFLVSGF